MGKHRHQKRYRRTVVTAVAMSAIGIPSVAMACADWPGSGQRQNQDTAAPAAAEDRWGDADRHRPWNGRQHGGSTTAPTSTPAATASPSKAGAPKHGSARPSHKPKKTAPGTSASRPISTAPKPTAEPTTAAPKPTTAAPESSTTAPRPTTAAPEPAAGASSPAATADATASGAVARVVELVNAERGKVGCSPVKVNPTLTEAAQDHSDDMAASGSMSHTGSDGSSPADRITRAGYNWSTYGENVAYGYSTPEQVMAGWMASPGHKENILNCAFEEIGVGLAQPGDYWTQNFGTAR
ncbi:MULTISPECIES: CAP domain-containing protein [unclassified Streptomyces]|uniref:CAP domain-containing protein n=1 Tax=unclassified Streptomyces TaxID=2593676 RepID=UPI0005A66759|nr:MULTISPECIES: CAP domain-containing protein [unclassified Streptomyces]ODA69342.1 Cysteine-rich secretory protein family protein [Streptomyces sp. AVP053U2]